MTIGADARELARLVGFAHGLESSVAALTARRELRNARAAQTQLDNIRQQIAKVRDRIQAPAGAEGSAWMRN